MRLFLAGILFFFLQSIRAQINIGHDTSVFTVDSTRKPVFCFHFKSIPEISYRWGFYHTTDIRREKLVFRENKLNDPYKNSDTMVCEDFRDSFGVYWVCLEITGINGLKDTLCKKVNSNYMHITRRAPEFTPKNGSTFNPFPLLENESLYNLVIYSRWGVKIFESLDKNIDWNGQMNNTGEKCPDGTYYYILKYRYNGKEADEPVLNGSIRLIW